MALYVLRRKEPGLARPFRIPGGAWVCALLAIGPAVLIGTLVWQDFEEQGWLKQRPTAIAIFAGVVVYQFRRKSALS